MNNPEKNHIWNETQLGFPACTPPKKLITKWILLISFWSWRPFVICKHFIFFQITTDFRNFFSSLHTRRWCLFFEGFGSSLWGVLRPKNYYSRGHPPGLPASDNAIGASGGNDGGLRRREAAGSSSDGGLGIGGHRAGLKKQSSWRKPMIHNWNNNIQKKYVPMCQIIKRCFALSQQSCWHWDHRLANNIFGSGYM